MKDEKVIDNPSHSVGGIPQKATIVHKKTEISKNVNKSSTKIEKLWIEAKSTVFRWTDEKVPKFIVESRLITLQSSITRHKGIPKAESIGNPTVPNSTWNQGESGT